MRDDHELTLLCYTSIASHLMTHDELIDLLEQSRENNGMKDVTGMLLYMDGCFFQVLEGEKAIVERLYEKIGRDKRHVQVMKLIEEPLDTRSFHKWTMGYQQVSRVELANITGLTDFLDRDSNGFETLEIGRARKLIEMFREGRWVKNVNTHYYRKQKVH